VQVQFDNQGYLGADPIVYTPTLGLTAYSKIDGQISAGGLTSQAVTTPKLLATNQESINAGAWQTIASLPLTTTSRNTGLIALDFQAQAAATTQNRVFVRYLIDGKIDPNDVAANLSPTAADATVDFANMLGNPVWHTLSLSHLITLTPGSHTISIQVLATNNGLTAGEDVLIAAPNLHLTGYTNITPLTGFSFDSSTGTLTINGATGNNTFNFSQHTTRSGTTLITTYTFTMNGSTASYTSNQLNQVIVNGNGGNDTATLRTNDTYTGADGKTHETVERLTLTSTSGDLQKLDASGAAHNFLQLNGFSKISATMGHADSGVFYDSPGDDKFVTSGLTSSMTGPGYANSITGAGHTYGYSINGGHDTATHYDGSGPSTYIASGSAYTLMQGTDNGQSFFNEAVGFTTNYGIARHRTQDKAIFYDSPGTDVFAGATYFSYMYSDDANGNFAYFNAAQGFGKVYAYSFVGGIDYAYNYDNQVNFVFGFHIVTP
jgi:hypothetical protein